MAMLQCPHCGQPGTSAVRKLCLGPASRAKCVSCGKPVGVPRSAMKVLIPLLAAFIIAEFVQPMELKVLVWMSGLVAGCTIQIVWVPLVPR
jgi:hypothetical protein